MSTPAESLAAIFALEEVEANVFRGESQDLRLPQLFGGQVLGQAAMAMTRTVLADKKLHSLHGYFVRPGRANAPVMYEVETIQDGRSFSRRRLTAWQDSKVIFVGDGSFHIVEEGMHHQHAAPMVPPPESLPTELELLDGKRELIAEIRSRYEVAEAIEIRPVEPIDPSNPIKHAPNKSFWFRCGSIETRDSDVHRSLLAYASDTALLITSLLPHGVSDMQDDMRVASLDHAIWFHSDCYVDDWLLYSTDSPWSGAGRGLARGLLFDRHGKLVASVAQEGLIRRL
ncbi:acyl-CoA thioesterase II [Pseudomonas putida]|uniref:Acyl-CoA thioesterase 2 n=1 Tax=Pseudomonas putida TaxID=303 RepID=A0AA37RBR0_PSEPU|nr:acyl-CoA thioesterase II [Pseudomonas putida]GLO12075.1 acyl-CoA thioesterase II [Pseudomonas putida]GLO35542.1 acyl-CoA thioesterase II [Pseudomonas putida]HDS0962785.1 acyl-CoA thioesterase II [Pseudomonas putida]HDS0990019.1 acyl-CoA thioesterase II [Pseudomonas putida]